MTLVHWLLMGGTLLVGLLGGYFLGCWHVLSDMEKGKNVWDDAVRRAIEKNHE